MNVKSTISNIGKYSLGTVIMIAFFCLPVIFLLGSLWVAEKFLPFLILLSIIAFCICLIILLPLGIFRVTRPIAGTGLFIASYIFGVTGWLMGLLLTWILWGSIAVIIGLFFMGIGVVPIAIIATLFNGMWLELGILILAIILTFGFRIIGLIFVESV